MKNKKIKSTNYQELIKEFFNEYETNHNEEEVYELAASILQKYDIEELPDSLSNINKNVLSRELGKMILDKVEKSESNSEKTIELVSLVISNNIKPKKSKKLELNDKLIKNLTIFSTVLALSLSGFSMVKSSNNIEKECISPKKIEFDINSISNLKNYVVKRIDNSKTIIYNKAKNFQNEIIKVGKDIQTAEKNKVLYNFKKCKTVDDILKRQKELESLNLTKKDKIYKDCKLAAPLQWFIYEQSVLNNLPTDLTFSIIHTETRGSFNSSGIESYNEWDGSYDLGLTQQNTKSSVVSFCQKYNISEEKARKLVRDNDYVNIVSCFLEYDEIKARIKNYDPIEYAGCYNGWLSWRQKEISRNYVEIFGNAYTNKYNKHHNVISKRKIKNKKEKSLNLLRKINNYMGVK